MAETLFTDIINNLGKSKVKVTGSGSKTGKQQIVGAPSGITSDKENINLQGSAEIPITNNVDFLLDGQYNKFRDNIEYKDNQIFLEDAPSNINRKVGIGINKDGEGFGGYAKYDIDNKEPEFFLGYKKTFADGGSTNGSGDKAFSAKVKELMDDGYDFGEAVKEAMRQGYAKAGLVDPENKVKKGQELGKGIIQRVRPNGTIEYAVTSVGGDNPISYKGANAYKNAQTKRAEQVKKYKIGEVKDYKGKYNYKDLIKDKDFEKFWKAKVDAKDADSILQGQGSREGIQKVIKKHNLKPNDYEGIFNKLLEEVRISEAVRKGRGKLGQTKLVSPAIVDNLMETFKNAYKPNIGTIDTKAMGKLLKLSDGELEKLMTFIDKDYPAEELRLAKSSDVSRTSKAAIVKNKLKAAGITVTKHGRKGEGSRYRFKLDKDINKADKKFKQLEKSKTFGFSKEYKIPKYPKSYKDKFTTLSKLSDEYKKMGYSKDRGAIHQLTKALNNAVKGMTDAEVRAFVNDNPKIKNLVTARFNARTGNIDNIPLSQMSTAQIRQNLQFEQDHIRGRSTVKYDAGTKKILDGLGIEYPKNLYIIPKAINMSTKRAVENFVSDYPEETKKINKINKWFKKNNLSYFNRRTEKYGGAKPSKSSVELKHLGITKTSQLKNLFSGTYKDSSGKKRVITKDVNKLINVINERNKVRHGVALTDDIKVIQKAANANGFRLNSFAGFMDFANSGIEFSPEVKKSMARVMEVGGKALRGVGKVAVVIDPMFAAYDFSSAIGKGATGKDAGIYAGQRFFEGLANLPDLAASGIKYGSDFLQGKKGDDLKFEQGTLYKPYDFAQRNLEEKLEAMPKSQKLRNIANKDFNVRIGANMGMVDDMYIPASRAEMEKARQKFLKSQMGPYYKYGIETLPRKVAKPNKYDIDT